MASGASGSRASFENLPKVIQEEITSFLRIEDTASLSAVSGVFHRIINNNPALWTRVAKKLNIKVTNIQDPQKDVLAYYKQQNDEIFKVICIIRDQFRDHPVSSPLFHNLIQELQNLIQELQNTSDPFLKRRIIEERLCTFDPDDMCRAWFYDKLFENLAEHNHLMGLKFICEFDPPSRIIQQISLSLAIQNGHIDIVQFFLERNPQLFLDKPYDFISYAISKAKTNGHTQTAELALQGQALAASLPPLASTPEGPNEPKKRKIVPVYSDNGIHGALNLTPQQMQELVKEGEYFVYGNDRDEFFLVTSREQIALPNYLFSMAKMGEQIDQNELDKHIKGNFILGAKTMISPEEVANRKRKLEPEKVHEVAPAPIAQGHPSFDPIFTLREPTRATSFNPSHEEFQKILKEGEYLIYRNRHNEHFLVTSDMTIRLPAHLFQHKKQVEQVDINGLEIFIKENLEGRNLGQRLSLQEVKERLGI